MQCGTNLGKMKAKLGDSYINVACCGELLIFRGISLEELLHLNPTRY